MGITNQEIKKVTIIGAGAVGANAAAMLNKLGFEVTLLDAASDILEGGGAATSNIVHSDGFEYHKEGHKITGEGCVEGAIVKSLLYPEYAYKTNICSSEDPIRFFVSSFSENMDGLTKENFRENAEHMREHFRKLFTHIKEDRCGGDEKKAEVLLGRNPQNFAYHLDITGPGFEYYNNIVDGYGGSGNNFNVPQYYALVKAALREKNAFGGFVHTQFNQDITSIEKQGYIYTVITSAGDRFESDHVIIAAGHSIPKLCNAIRGEGVELSRQKDQTKSSEGTYYLNAMMYVRLPKTADKHKIAQLRHINFVLQAEGGCMFACLVPPNAEKDGYGAIYYPSEKGSQITHYTYNKDHQSPPVKDWEKYIRDGLPGTDERARNILEQAYTFYPFLKGKDGEKPYVGEEQIDRIVCRTVFNAATPDSDIGKERRVRGMIEPQVVTRDGHVVAVSAPKWTNCELVALMVVDQAIQVLGKGELAKNRRNQENMPHVGFGPTRLDVEAITRDLHFRNVKPSLSDAIGYAERHGFPGRIVDPMFGLFTIAQEDRIKFVVQKS